MKFIYTVLALAASLVVAQADNYGCSIYGMCAKVGERCDPTHYNFTNPTAGVVDVACEYGSFCPSTGGDIGLTPVCTPLQGLGEVCNTEWGQCAEPYECIKGFCNIQNYLGFGEECNTDLQCTQNLKCLNDKCGILPGVKCSQGYQCPYGQYCNTLTTTYTPDQCVNWLTTGQECTDVSQCAPDHFCGLQNSAATNTTCQPQFSKTAGMVCSVAQGSVPNPISIGSRYECASNLLCAQNSSFVYVCTAAPTIPSGSCTNNVVPSTDRAQCPDFSECQCTSPTDTQSGSCTQTSYTYSTSCQTTIQNLVSCGMKNECPFTIENLGPDSCIMKHCSKELCAQNSGCFHESQTCGDAIEFPICQIPSSSSIVLPSFVILIFAIIALLF